MEIITHYLKMLTFTTLLLCLFSQSIASSVIEIDSDMQIEFAEHYFSNGEYSRAIDEYKRFIYFFPEHGKVEMAMYKIGMSYFNTNDYKKATGAFSKIIDRQYSKNGNTSFETGNSDYITKAYYMITECHLKLNSLVPAVSTLRNLLAITEDIEVRDETYYRLGWICLEAGLWDKARSYFGQISPENREKYKLKKLSDELGKKTEIQRKSPWTAGFLSIIPGGGYLYCERYHDAMIAFLVNSVMGYAAYEAFDDGHYALGGLIGFIEMGFYSGNIYGAVNSTHKYNRNKQKHFIEKLKKNTRVKLSSGYKKRGIAISFQYDF
ncbi:MAG: tetratricopeptide repeat protein [Desulfobacteraceae bacterium]|nr:tetratricopeptide repeat protein [Desulfobacteraceae bacterium]